MATVYLHIGAPKTATSSLQAVLAHNDESLLEAGVLYPRRCRHSNAHHPLICDLMLKYSGREMSGLWYGEVPVGSAWEALSDELAERKPATVVISSELFFGQARHLESMLGDIEHALSGHRLRVVAYLRRQDQLYASFYNQDVKGTRQWGETAYQFYQTHQLFERDYHSLLAAWGNALGKDNVLIRPFAPAEWVDGDIVSDFCHLTGLPPLRTENHESNEGLGPNQLYLKRCLNRCGYDKTLNDQVLGQLLQFCPEQGAGNYRYVNRRQYRQFRTQWLRTNEQLSRAFLGGQCLFSDEPPRAKELQEHLLDTDSLMSFLERMMGHYRRSGDGELRALFARAACLMIAEQSLWSQVDSDTRLQLMSWT